MNRPKPSAQVVFQTELLTALAEQLEGVRTPPAPELIRRAVRLSRQSAPA